MIERIRAWWSNFAHAVEHRFPVPPRVSPTDYYSILFGAFCTALFCFFLVSLIFKSRRGSPVDSSLAVVLGLFGIIAALAVVRITNHLVLLPYLTPSLWIATAIAEIVASVFIVREVRARSD